MNQANSVSRRALTVTRTVADHGNDGPDDLVVAFSEPQISCHPGGRRWHRDMKDFRKILDVGSGRRPLQGDGVVTLDWDRRLRPDVAHDLSVFPWPFDDDSFDGIHCSHVIEHLADTVLVVGEILRVAEPNCRVYIEVPHFSSATAYGDPTHKALFAAKTMDFFTSNYFEFSHQKFFQILSRRIVFSKAWTALGLSALFNAVPRMWEDKLHGCFPAKTIEWDLAVR